MSRLGSSPTKVDVLDRELITLVRLAAAIAAQGESAMRASVVEAVAHVRPEWAEEVVLQSYLFAGFPRALNASREWRRASGRAAPASDDGEQFDRWEQWAAAGKATCAVVYGPFYDKLRENIRALHPALDAWMIVEGYGKVLSRPALNLRVRELCIVAACAAAEQDRQLHSHLHGAIHAGASAAELFGVLDALADMLSAEQHSRYRSLLAKVLT